MKMPHLNRALVLEAPTQVSDGAGGYIRQWEPLGVHWAAIKPGSGRETAAFAATVSRVPYRITVRAAPHGAASRPVAGQRFREGNRFFEITAVAEHDADQRYLTCHATEETAS
ncbi:phage head-tail adaptor, putative, SPP1 family [Yoonia tamlensis]|uniref:Phage head-tail adaptor, putative, SPP1 family n=1 Tax=Yoonia tamlensis TaxID=390270 RepID=A0A1I6GHE8_9RHOB|nr:phage head closure protein [Yoonia tamlensis]SFR41606.1 phage head-tail adaptor, putative, SPP1 family [Yoonia tamlensis]